MSELYLVLHRRLNSVADWVELGTTVMKTARERLGLSYEAVARQIPVSSKTYERYEKKGRVPRPLLPKIADVLQLEVEEPERVRVTLEDGGDDRGVLTASARRQLEEAVQQFGLIGPQLAALADQQEEQDRHLVALEAHLDARLDALASQLERLLAGPQAAEGEQSPEQSS